jgi:serine/threonine protein kinase
MGSGPLLEGSVLGGAYRIGKLLGEGAMGAVYEATQVSLGRPVAVKVLKPDATGKLSAEELERFGREARSAAALGHPNIVQVTDFQPGSDPPFLVMERLSGESLRATIARERSLPVARVAFVGTQILDALAAAHEAGIVHRDVKPDNVFLTRMAAVSDLVKVVDFGIAKVSSGRAITAFGAIMGSPAYMSPEQAAGRPVDPRSDLWGVGATLYHAASGKLPFPATSLAELLLWIAERPPVPLTEVIPGIDPRLVLVLDRALSRDPAHRFQNAREMQAALAPLLPNASPSMAAAAPPGPANREPLRQLPQPPRTEALVGPFAASVSMGGSGPGNTGSPGPAPTNDSPPVHLQSAHHYVQPTHSHAAFTPSGAQFPLGSPGPQSMHRPPSSPAWPWLFAVFGAAVLALFGALWLLSLPYGSKTNVDPSDGTDAPSSWNEIRGTASHTCFPRRWAVHGSGKLDFEPLDAQASAGLASQLGDALDTCGKDCPGEASFMLRIYNDGLVGEVGEPVVLCPARDECVHKALSNHHVGVPPHAADAVVELTCTFP